MARKGASRARHGMQLKRRVGYRPGHDRLLIVSEESKIEPYTAVPVLVRLLTGLQM